MSGRKAFCVRDFETSRACDEGVTTQAYHALD